MGKIGKLDNAFDLILHVFSTRSGIQPGTEIGNRSKSKYYRKFEFPATSTPKAKTGTDPTHAESGKISTYISLGIPSIHKNGEMVGTNTVGPDGDRILGERLAHEFV